MTDKNHWTARKKRAAQVVDRHRGELADVLLEILGERKADDPELMGAAWHIPDQLDLDITYLMPVVSDEAITAFENEIDDVIDRFLKRIGAR